MTQVLSEFNSSIRNSLKQFSLSENKNTEQIKTHLLSLKLTSDDEITRLNSLMQKEIKMVLTEIMGKGDLQKVGNLIALFCDVSIDQKYGQNPTQKPSIKQSLAIMIVQDVLECLGINDLRQILPIITEKICLFKQLDLNDQNRMLKIINHLLKRISKTEDYLIRGQLQFTLTKILPICHDSGFHYRIPNAKGIQIAEDEQAEEQKAAFSSDGITYQFYKDFWELQKYLMDPNELSSEEATKSSQDQTPKKQAQSFKSEPLISLRLKHIERVLNEVIVYMAKHPCNSNLTSVLNQPIKFLTNTHLLEFQLSDAYFRKIILVQVMLFTFTLKHLKPTGNILKNVMMTEAERQIINKIELMAQKYLESLQKSQFSKKQEENTNQNFSISVLDVMKCFFSNELEWLQLKDHWKEIKKAFLRIEPIIPENDLKQKKSKEGTDYNKKISEIHKKITNQMNIEGDTLLKFLTEPTLPHIVTTPTQTSFAYYWSQGKTCLESFDFQNSQQNEFESKSEYNLFEWKALRSLYKDYTKQISLGERNPKLREYRALAFIEKKEKEIKEKQAKFNVQNSLITEQKTVSLPVILQVSESKEATKQRDLQSKTDQKKVAPALGSGENDPEEDDQPSKKQKID